MGTGSDSHCVAQVCLEFTALLLQPLKCWNYWCEPPRRLRWLVLIPMFASRHGVHAFNQSSREAESGGSLKFEANLFYLASFLSQAGNRPKLNSHGNLRKQSCLSWLSLSPHLGICCSQNSLNTSVAFSEVIWNGLIFWPRGMMWVLVIFTNLCPPVRMME